MTYDNTKSHQKAGLHPLSLKNPLLEKPQGMSNFG